MVICDFAGAAGNAAGTSIKLTLPAASSYIAGSTVQFIQTSYTGGANSNFTLVSPGSTVSGFNLNSVSTNGAGAALVTSAFSSFTTDGGTRWYRH